MSDLRFTSARRTVIKQGREVDYTRIHSTIPIAVERALRVSGVLRWHIWRDGMNLFHQIETRAGYDTMITEITALGPIDSVWDDVIADLLDARPGSDVMLPLVWSMDPSALAIGDDLSDEGQE